MSSRWFVTGSLALVACTSPRQLVLSIDTTAGVPCDIDRIRIVATSLKTTTFERSLVGAHLPVTSRCSTRHRRDPSISRSLVSTVMSR